METLIVIRQLPTSKERRYRHFCETLDKFEVPVNEIDNHENRIRVQQFQKWTKL